MPDVQCEFVVLGLVAVGDSAVSKSCCTYCWVWTQVSEPGREIKREAEGSLWGEHAVRDFHIERQGL